MMADNVVWGTDFKKANQAADRAFWIGPEAEALAQIRDMILALDTAPAEYTAPEQDPA